MKRPALDLPVRAAALAALVCLLPGARPPAAAQAGTNTPEGAQESAPPARQKPASPFVPAPDFDEPLHRDDIAEQVLEAAIKAQGGAEAILGRQTIYIKYAVRNVYGPEPDDGTITIWFKRPAKLRQEVSYPGKRELRVYDGERAWVDTGGGPKLLSPTTARMMVRGLREFDSPIMYKEGTLKYLNIDKDPAGRLSQKLTWRHEGYARDIYVDVNTSQVLFVGEWYTPTGPTARMKFFTDYQPVQGMLIPFRSETWVNGERYSESRVVEAKFNLPIEDSMFEYPGSEGRAEPPAPASPPSRR